MNQDMGVIPVISLIGYPIGIVAIIVGLFSIYELFSSSDNPDRMMPALFRMMASFFGFSIALNIIGNENIIKLLVVVGIIISGTIFGTSTFWLVKKYKSYIDYKNFKKRMTALTNIPDNFENLAPNIETIEQSLFQLKDKLKEVQDKKKQKELNNLQKLLTIKKTTFENLLKTVKEEQPELRYELNI